MKLNIQWQVGNQCNFRCDYCHRNFYDGSSPFLTFEEFNQAFINLEQSIDNYQLVEIEFLGGEVTISDTIKNHIADSTNKKFCYKLTTNGSASLDWWKLAIPNLSSVNLAYHPSADIEHFKNVIALLQDKNIPIDLIVNAHNEQDRWDKAVHIYEQYKDLIPTTFKALFANYQKGNDKFLDYSTEQWDYYLKENNITVDPAPVEVQIHQVESTLYNNYKGHLCYAGVNQVVIDYYGYVYRGWCFSNGGFGNLFEKPIQLLTTARVCTKEICKNGFDLQAKKSDQSWGL